ncbi:MAG: DUF3276 family protein [Bacteroidia bacterium]
MDFNEQTDREEIYSKPVRAGKRTYFFDVKSTKGDDLYLTITESKKRFRDDGTFFYEKHKIFLYKEDFEKFAEGLNDSVNFIVANNGQQSSGTDTSSPRSENQPEEADKSTSEWSNVDFEDLDNSSS